MMMKNNPWYVKVAAGVTVVRGTFALADSMTFRQMLVASWVWLKHWL